MPLDDHGDGMLGVENWGRCGRAGCKLFQADTGE